MSGTESLLWYPRFHFSHALPRYRLTRVPPAVIPRSQWDGGASTWDGGASTWDRARAIGPLAVTMAEAVLHLRLAPGSETGPEASLIERMIYAATLQLENYASCAVMEQEWIMRMASLPQGGYSIVIPKPPLQSIVSFNNGADLLDPADYIVELDDVLSGTLTPASGYWPADSSRAQAGNVAIRFVAGYPTADDVPETIKQAILMCVASWHENRESLQMFTLQPMVEIGWEGLLAPYRSQGFA